MTGCWSGPEASGGRLIPFCRLDPAEDPVAEAERALDAGAVGIKLHPRAQAFALASHPGVESIFALADERQVPMLIHAGAGLPPEFGLELVEIVERHPGVRLILAHMGVTDQAVMADGLRDHPSIVYDTSWMNAFEIMTLLARIPAERIVFGSDPPYGRTFNGLYLLLRSLRCLGCDDDALAEILGGSVRRMLAGEPLATAKAPPAPARAAARPAGASRPHVLHDVAGCDDRREPGAGGGDDPAGARSHARP